MGLAKSTYPCLLTVSLALMLAACGVVDSGGSQGIDVEDPRNPEVNEGTTVELNAADLVDTDSVESYLWSQIGGEPTVTLNNANRQIASFIAPAVKAPGQVLLMFRLTVTDEFGARNDNTVVRVTVLPVNALPTVNAGSDRAVSERSPVALNGSAEDRDGTIISFRWAQLGEPRAGAHWPWDASGELYRT